MATRPKAVIESRNGEEFSPITIAKNVLTDDGQNLHDILSDRKEDMMTPTIENSSSMFKVGQGDNIDYSANVVNGAYESMVLKGKTMVNCIQESSSQDVVLPYEFEEGQYVTINDTKESGALGVELKGQTLVNLKGVISKNPQWVETDDAFCLDLPANNGQPNISVKFTSPLKRNTEYTVFVNIKSYTTGHPHICFMDETNRVLASDREWTPAKAGVLKTKFTTSSTVDAYVLRIIPRNGIDNTYTFSKEFIILEGDYTNVDIPYFEGMASCKMPILCTTGKNLFDIGKDTNHCWQGTTEFVDGRIKVTSTHNSGVTYHRTYNIPVEKGRTYCVNVNREGDGYWYLWKNGDTTKSIGNPFTVDDTFDSVAIGLYCAIGEGNVCYFKPQLEEGSTATAYEPYKSSILSLPEEVVLRSLPNGVCDTFNTRTGVYTQRIKEIVFDGSNDEGWNVYRGDWVLENSTVFCTYISGVKGYTWSNYTGKEAISDKIPSYPDNWLRLNDVLGMTNDNTEARKQFRIPKSYLETDNVDGFRKWLEQNPVTACFELATPIVTKISLPSTLKSWNTTTHIHSEIPENSLYPILSHSNPTYPVILKPSTKYSIVANSYSNNHTNSAINFNLGGATASTTVGNRVTTITTPSTLTSEELVMSGRGNKLNNMMIIEGDVVGDEPYFEGICDVKSPILTNTGKNLYYMHQDINNTYGISEFYENGFVTTSLNAMGIFGLTKKTNIAEQGDNILNPTSIQEGKTYTISCKVTKISGTSSKLHFLGLRCHNHEGDVIEVSNVRWNDWELEYDFSNTVELSKTVVCNKSFNHVVFGGQIGFDGSNDVYKITDFQLEESSTPTSHEPYKSNILSANGDKIELTEDMFEQGAIAQYINSQNIGKTYQWMKDNSDSNYDKRRLRLKNLVKVKPNTKLILQNTDNFMYAMSGFDSNKLNLGTFDTSWIQNAKVTIPQDVHYISLFIRKKDDTGITINDFKNAKFTLSEVDKTIVLRSLPNGVCDTLNVETGEYVQRIGECRLDGSQTVKPWWSTTSTVGVLVQITTMKNISNLVCDRLPAMYYRDINNNTYDAEGIASWDVGNSVNFRILKSKLETEDINGVKKYLQQNPVTVQYELEVPIVKTVDLSGFPFSYENGHVILSSGSIGQSLTPTVEYSVATNRNGQIRSNQKMVERHQKQLDRLQAIILTNLVNTQYEQALTNLKYDLKNVREEVK